MGLFKAILAILLPVLGGLLIVAAVYAWCGKAPSLREGVNIVITELFSLFKDESVAKTQEFYEIEEREFAGFRNRVSEFFSYFVFVRARNFRDYMIAEYRVGDMQVSIEVLEQEWMNFLKASFNIPNYIRIPVFIVHDAEAGVLHLYYAWNEAGIKKIEDIRESVKSRQIQPPSNDIFL